MGSQPTNVQAFPIIRLVPLLAVMFLLRIVVPQPVDQIEVSSHAIMSVGIIAGLGLALAFHTYVALPEYGRYVIATCRLVAGLPVTTRPR